MPNDIVLLSGGAAQGLVTALAPSFRAETGADVTGVFGAVGAMREKLGSGHHADVLILTKQIVAELSQSGAVIPDSVSDVGMVRTGIAVRTGDAAPPVSTAAQLKAALLAADEIHFPDPALATAGIHFAKVLDRLGIADSVVKAVRNYPNGATAMRALAASTAAGPIGCTQATEIIVTPGVSLVGALPGDLGLETIYAVAVCSGTTNEALARAFAGRLTGPATAEQRRLAGFD